MRKSPSLLLLMVTCFFLFSCKTIYQPHTVQYKDYRINKQHSADSQMNVLLKPYSDSVNKNMNDVIAIAGMELEKKQPESTLGNLLADAMLYVSGGVYQTKVHASFINFGGIRLNSIPAGNITRGKVFETAPFDNIIVLLNVTGNTLQQFLDLVAAKGGWPCAGITYQIKNKKAINIVIGGTPIDDGSVYKIALVDYVANGGDDCVMLKNIPQENNGYLFRDAVIAYFTKLNKEGKKIEAKIEKRVTNAE